MADLRQLLARSKERVAPSAARLFCVLVLFVGGSLLGVFVATSSASPLHSSGCHSAHTCPSDHHTYVWFDGSGQGWDCAEPTAREVTAADTTSIVYQGLPYLCHAAGPAAPSTTTASTTTASTRTSIPAETCGVERWAVKTLSDSAAASVNYTSTPSSVAALRALPGAAVGGSTPRIAGVEMTTYTIPVRLVSMKLEDDKDIHLVVADPATGRTMIVEFPNPGCQGAISSPHVTEMAAARAALVSTVGLPGGSFVNLSGRATITGVGFFDVIHGQTGVAPNGIELHPALAFSTGPAGATTTTGTTTTASAATTTTSSTATTPKSGNNGTPRIVSAKFVETPHGSRGSRSITEQVRFTACDDRRGPLLAEIRESKGVGEQVLATAHRVKLLKLTAACGSYAIRWRMAAKFFGVGAYVISLRVRDSRGAWSGAKTHRSFTGD